MKWQWVHRWRTRRRVALLIAGLAWVLFIGPWPVWLAESRPGVTLPLEFVGTALDGPYGRPPTERTPEGLRVGFARVDVTPHCADLPLAGYGHRAFTANQGVADPISVRAVALLGRDVRCAFVSGDFLLFNASLVDAVMREVERRGLSWRREEVYFGATHTHSGPGGYAAGWAEMLVMGRRRPEAVEAFVRAIVDALAGAEKAAEPAGFVEAHVEVDENLIRNRTVPSDPANRWLDVLQFRQRDNARPLATLVIFSAHATCRPGDDLRLSGDYPAVVCREIEAAGGGPCLFLAGAVGSMGPPNDLGPRAKWSEVLGRRLAAEAIAALASPAARPQAEVVLERTAARLALSRPIVKLSRRLCLAPFVSGRVLPRSAWVQGVRVGDCLLVGAPADYSGNLALELRHTVPGYTTIVTSFNGEYVGYLLPPAYYDLPKYEPRSMCLYGRHAGAQFQEALRAVAERLTAARPPR